MAQEPARTCVNKPCLKVVSPTLARKQIRRPGSENNALAKKKEINVGEPKTPNQQIRVKSQKPLPKAKSRFYCFAAVPSMPREAVVLVVAEGDALIGPFISSEE